MSPYAMLLTKQLIYCGFSVMTGFGRPPDFRFESGTDAAFWPRLN